MKYITATNANRSMLWQMQVQHYNFERLGVDLKDVYGLVVVDSHIPQEYYEYAKITRANILFIQDTREKKHYVPSLKPFAYAKFLEQHPELADEKMFYCDQDCYMRRVPDWTKMEEDAIYVSDCRGYLNSDYIDSKGEGLLEDMCKIVGISARLYRKQKDNEGGCQHYGKMSMKFWQKVEKDSVLLYDCIEDMNKYADAYFKKNGKAITKNTMIQRWCAEMWATIMNQIGAGYKVIIHNELKFTMASNSMKTYMEYNLYHNTGLSNADKKDVFNKELYHDKLLLDIEMPVKLRMTSATYQFANEVRQAQSWLIRLKLKAK